MAFVGSSEEVSWAWSQALLLKAAQGSKAASTCGPGPGGARMSWAGGRALSRRVFVSPFAAASSDLRDSLLFVAALWPPLPSVCSLGLLPRVSHGRVCEPAG